MDESSLSKKVKKWSIWIMVDLIIVCLAIYGFYLLRAKYYPSVSIEGVYIEHPYAFPVIHLVDNHGKIFTKQQLKGHWTFVFFGFTHCPMICPTTLDELNKMYVILQKELPAKLLPQVAFISIDPERDTVAQLNKFVHQFNSHFIGARTDASHIQMIENQLSVSVSNKNGNLTHSADILLVNPNADVQAYFIYPHHAESLAEDYVKIINAKKTH